MCELQMSVKTEFHGGYCLADDTPLVLDEEFEQLRKNCLKNPELVRINAMNGTLNERMVKCPKCGLSWHEGNPAIKMTSKQYTAQIMAEAEANWRKNHRSWWL